jgi:ABC-type Zn uptake system ZnuABC Zn-binding protein ZnuA/ABC-type Mn2+/Zn2+ transport system permease subunit
LLEPFQLPFVQRGLIEVLILAVPAGLLGTWIVLRGLAFFSHAVGTATFPGLVLADGLGFAAPLGAFGAAVAFAAGATALRGRRTSQDAAVALVLVGCLATGVILASDVFGSGSNIETLLFGSLLLVDGGDLALAAGAAAATLLATVLIGQHWLRAGFDPTLADSSGPSSQLFDAVLLGLVALAMVAALTVVGALLVAALFVVPAITARLLTDRLLKWQLLSIGLVAMEGTVGLWLSVKTNAPPGATIACVAGATFAAVAVARALARVPRGATVAAALGALALLVAGCGSDSSGEGGQVKVVATTTQVADFVREVGGEAVEVTQIIQPNSDPHDYEPRPSDVEAVADAELVFVSGRGLDDWAEELVSDSGGDAQIVNLGAMGPIRLVGEGHEHEHEEEAHAEENSHEEEHAGEVGHEHEHENESELDPHWWHDPRNVEAAIPGIENVLVVADRSHRAEFIRNADAYVAEVKALDAGIAKCIDSVPASERKLVTDHDAFGYFANRYGIEVVGAVIPSQTTQAQASAKDLSELAKTIEAENVKAVFPESSLSADVVEAIADQTGASADYTLYGDSLGPEGSSGDTYLRMEEANADAVVRGFTGGSRGCEVTP